LFEPLQQRLGLRMIGKPGNVYRKNGVGQNLYRVSDLKIILAGARLVGKLPSGNQVVDERIVEDLRKFVAESGHVLKASAESAWGNPAGKGKHPA